MNRELFLGFALRICMCLGLSSSVTFAQSSPAGGGYLSLDGQDDFAVARYNDSLKIDFTKLTVEAWIDLQEPPFFKSPFILIGKSENFILTIWAVKDANPVGGFKVEAPPGVAKSISLPPAIFPKQWTHIAGFYNGKAVSIAVNGKGLPLPIQGEEHLINSSRDLMVGTIDPIPEDWKVNNIRSSPFNGFIDELRISSVLRYNIENGIFEVPKGRFEPDEHTVGLWHFDESTGATLFHDASSNKNHLIGKNGAQIIQDLAVFPSNKLAIIWGRLKFAGQ